MSSLEHGLGGRLALLEPAKLQPKQLELYSKINSDIVPLADASGFKSKDDQRQLIGPFNATLKSVLAKEPCQKSERVPRSIK